MSSFTYTDSLDPITIPQLAPASGQHQTPCSITRQDSEQPPRKTKIKTETKTKAFVRKVWTTIKKPGDALVKHVNDNQRLRRLLPWRVRESATLPEQPRSSPEATNTVGSPSPQDPSNAPTGGPPASEPLSVDHPSQPPASTVIVEETILAYPVVPNPARRTASDSSISLSSRQDSPPSIPPSPAVQHSVNTITNFEGSFRPGSHATTTFSDETTLLNSTAVNDNLSRGFSSPSVDANRSTLQVTSQHLRPTPRIQTEHLNVPGSDDDDGHSTVRNRSNSSPASVEEDLHGIGRHFEEPRVVEETPEQTPES